MHAWWKYRKDPSDELTIKATSNKQDNNQHNAILTHLKPFAKIK